MAPKAIRRALWLAALALSFSSACTADTADQNNPIGAGGAAAAVGGFGAQGGVGAGAMAPPTGGMGLPTAGTSVPVGGAGGLGGAGAGAGAIGGVGGVGGMPDACVDCEADAAVPDAEVPDEDNCIVMPITDELREIHGSVYTRYAAARGVPVLSTEAPSEESMRRACMLLMDLGQNPEVLETMLEEDIGLVVMALSETSADFPEFAAWGVPDSRARGLGGVPRGLCAEENVMCDRSNDRWRGESICVHEFGHTMHLGVYNKMDSTFDRRVEDAYDAARSAGKFSNTYAASNAVEYFGEGVQDWYNTNIESIPSNGVHNEINTREELEEYDPALYEILAEVLPDEPSYKDCYYYE